MAKRQETTTTDAEGVEVMLQINKVPVAEGTKTLRSNRTGRAGRKSQFQPVIDAVNDMPKGEVLEIKGVGKMQVQGLRNLFFKNYSKDLYTVKSVKEQGTDNFICVIGHKEDFEK